MRFSTIASVSVLGLAASASQAPADKRQLYKFDKCTNYGEEWCLGDEILTCKQYAGTDKGRVKSTHKSCVEKREEKRDVGDPCPKTGVTWCQDYEVLTCVQVEVNNPWGVIATTNIGCGTKRSENAVEKRQHDCLSSSEPWCENGVVVQCLYFFGLGRSVPIATDEPCSAKALKARDVGDFCNKPGNTWCQDHQVLTCSAEYTITSTGQACGTKARDVNDPCPKPGATWCQDYQVLTCSANYRIVDTGTNCGT